MVCIVIFIGQLQHQQAKHKSGANMSSTVLEQLRAEQEAIESVERAAVSVLSEKPRNVRHLLSVTASLPRR